MKKILLLAVLTMTVSLSACAPQAENKAQETAVNGELTLSPEAIKIAELETVTVESRLKTSVLQTVAQIQANENRVFHINSLTSGRVTEDRVLLGDTVQKGQVIAVIQNIEVAKINAEFIHQLHQNELDARQVKVRLDMAQKNLEREKKLLDEGISPRKDYLQAQTDYTLLQSQLEGLQEHTIHIKSEANTLLSAYGAQPTQTHSERVNASSFLKAPRAGVVTAKSVVMGDTVSPEKTLYEIADLNDVWLDMTVYSKDIEQIKLGQKVTFTTDALPQKTFSGVINYIQPQTANGSAAFIVRVFLKNPQLLLRPGFLGQAVIETQQEKPMAYVPLAAVQTYGKETFVFLVQDNGRFKKQLIELSEKSNDGYYIKTGLQSGDKVVGKGSFALKSELLKSEFSEEE